MSLYPYNLRVACAAFEVLTELLLEKNEFTTYFWKRTVVGHPWYCPNLAESFMSLSCRIAEFPQKQLERMTQ